MRHRDDIQGLRAVAVLLVVLGHARVPFLQGGFVAFIALAAVTTFDFGAGNQTAIFDSGNDSRHARMEISGQLASAR